jgi:riboflavin transporter FmnP
MEQNESVVAEKSKNFPVAEENKQNAAQGDNLVVGDNSTQDVNQELNQNGNQEVKEKKSFGKAISNYFTATRITYIAVFTALAYVMYLWDFSILPAVTFLKIDFSNVFVMIAGFSLGPVAGVVVGVLKELIHALTASQTVGVGELANIIVMLPYILIPSIVYKKHKGIKVVLLTLALGCIGQVLISIPVNYFINFPFFFGFDWEAGMSYYISVWYWVVLFNLIKTVIISVAVILLYKPLSNLIKLTNKKFTQVKHKK